LLGGCFLLRSAATRRASPQASRIAGRRDLDNLLKAVLDLLVMHKVIKTDADVAALDSGWDKLVPGGRFRLEDGPVA
jgi:Holliday junction resolvase RusA-like endonuclease